MSTDELQSFAPPTDPTYGNWNKKPRGGLYNLGPLGTGLGGAVAILTLLTFMFTRSLITGGIVFVVGLVVVGVLVIPDRHNRNTAIRIQSRVNWWKSKSSGSNLYRSGPLTPQATNRLPGILGQTTSNEFVDISGNLFGMLSYKAGYHTIALKAFPDGSTNSEKVAVNHAVAKYGQWLASHGERHGVIGASVIIETAPDTGGRLRRENINMVKDFAPKMAKDVMDEILRDYPAGSADVNCWITLSFTEKGRVTKGRGEADRIQKMASSLAVEIPDIVLGLNGSGAGVVRPMDVQTLCETVRVAYDPAAASAVEEARAAGVSVEAMNWDDVGPVACDPGWDHMIHDSGVSVTAVMTLPPRQNVHSDVLKRMLAPSPGVLRKRVALHYRPLSLEEASTAVERDHSNALFALNSTKKKTARLARDARIAAQTAEEEASGAGLDDFALVLTLTVGAIEQLPEVKNSINTLGTVSKLRLRLCYGFMDSAFAFTLPVGLQPQLHINLPKTIKRVIK